jgi:hypothetical protein
MSRFELTFRYENHKSKLDNSLFTTLLNPCALINLCEITNSKGRPAALLYTEQIYCAWFAVLEGSIGWMSGIFARNSLLVGHTWPSIFVVADSVCLWGR